MLQLFLFASLAIAQTSVTSIVSTSPPTTTPTNTQSYNSVLINGTLETFRVLSTLSPSIGNFPPLLPNVQDPKAVDAQVVCPGYLASNVVTSNHGLQASLQLAGPPCNVYGTDIAALVLSVEYQNDTRLAIKISPSIITEANATQYVISPDLIAQPGTEDQVNNESSDLDFTWSNDPTFSFQVYRRSTGDSLVSSNGTVLVFEDQFVEIKSSMPQNYNLNGLGERISSLRLGNNYTATLYASGASDPVDGNIYGVHPFYVDTRYFETTPDGKRSLVSSPDADPTKQYSSSVHGVYYRNVHPHEVVLEPTSLTWRTLGGSVELYFFSGPSQPEVTKQYLSVVGLPALQQYWTFGYHQCRWGYTNWTQLQDVVDNMRAFDIPLETIWNDIDHMTLYRDFDNDPIRYGYEEGASFLANLHAAGQHYVPIVDAALYVPNPLNLTDAYPPYTRGNDSNVFLNNVDGDQYIGAVWPGYTAFTDFRALNSQSWWTNELEIWHNNVAYDGIWIDMSEIDSFCIGSCGTGHVQENPVHPPNTLPGELGNIIYAYPEEFGSTNSLNQSEWQSARAGATSQSAYLSSKSHSASATATMTVTSTSYLVTKPTGGVRNVTYPPYVINNSNGALGGQALSPDAVHADGTQEYDTHNTYGAEIIKATYNGLQSVFPGKRPFIIARSNFAGSGSFAGHWGGDNNAQWLYMYYSIPQALSHSLFGFPMFGVDTCGFRGNTDEELCNRWMQLSAFFPFYRNHNQLSDIPQEPYRWQSVITASKSVMSIRYSLLPYIYTLMYNAHSTGATVMRALAWEFPNDPTLIAADRQFLLGPSIMVIPVLTPLARNVSGVFPGIRNGEKWYNWHTQTSVQAQAGENKTLNGALGHIPVFIRGGAVLPLQGPAYTTTESRQNDWSVLLALGSNHTATGSLYLDDGESLVQDATRHVSFSAVAGSLTVTTTGAYVQTQPLANVTVLGMMTAPSVVSFNAGALSSWTYDRSKNALYVNALQNVTVGGVWMANWTLSWS